MCEECRMHPCHPSCPNAPEPRRVFLCSGCNGDILEGEDYWDIMGEQYCEECINRARQEAVYEEDLGFE